MSDDQLEINMEISLAYQTVPQMSQNGRFPKQTPFFQIVLTVLQEMAMISRPVLTEWIITTGRPLNTPFFPVAPNEEQKRKWQKRLANTVRVIIPEAEWKLPYEQIYAKYRTREFHFMKKPAA